MMDCVDSTYARCAVNTLHIEHIRCVERHLPESTSNDGFDDRTALVVEEMNLVNDE